MNGFSYKLLSWFKIAKRKLPWRNTSDVYKIWLSEIILQQTRVEQGKAYYYKFIETFPQIQDLANAEEQEVLKCWEGLGYYTRARNLHATAKNIVNEYHSIFPNNYRGLLKLKGVGPYTAAAIASIVFKEPVAAVDGNVMRVVTRLLLIKNPVDKQKTQQLIRNVLQPLIDVNNPGDFNQAMMELGALICTPKNPKCDICPVVEHCLAFVNNKQTDFPVKASRVKVKPTYFNYLVPDCNGKTVFTKREEGIWKGLFQFPLIISENRLLKRDEVLNKISSQGYKGVKGVKNSPIISHLLTHKKIKACFWSFNTDGLNHINPHHLMDKVEVVKYPMPKLLANYIHGGLY